MCIYWKKLHTCGHTSDRPYIEMCRPGCLSNTVCASISTDTDVDTLRASHFPCYPCIKAEVRTEAEARMQTVYSQSAQRAEQVYHEKQDRVRREAREKAAREREEEARLRVVRLKEEEKAKREGGAWIESGKKGKGRKGVGFPVLPHSASAGVKALGEGEKKENEGSGGVKELEKAEDKGGRAGTWGPKKILSRKEAVGASQAQAQGQVGKK
ncbi:hypothetical protein BDU57DRAFT_156952 [Ampelomyces quisqualis]|uniref:Uncharacterized protein n=1 Tax=Ampelomyces quisqualis TaxID=50730 RepID=A0A6A5QW00_AMPQU|nr:hypothetical protein BDU57DRAFT_156952 [Ampelomyces quisqualis]